MGARTSGRECALMVLFGLEDSPNDAATAVRQFFSHLAPHTDVSADQEARDYAMEVTVGVTSSQTSLDELLRSASTNWRLERMSRVDRNVLRIAAWELTKGVPRAIAIDEAVELAKRFGTETSGAFVNGVLSKVADQVSRESAP
ncbi:MAG: transcription antitermination factor NusB [Polyangiaceae bacterium]|nr:transcription antitermination factor NusB [Polyangiaceae bacterium]